MNPRYNLLTVKEAAAQLGRPTWLIYEAIEKETLATVKLKKRKFILQRDLDEFIERMRSPALGTKKTKLTFEEGVSK